MNPAAVLYFDAFSIQFDNFDEFREQPDCVCIFQIFLDIHVDFIGQGIICGVQECVEVVPKDPFPGIMSTLRVRTGTQSGKRERGNITYVI